MGDEYLNFYCAMSGDLKAPLAVRHFRAIGQVEFTALLFVPRSASLDLFGSKQKQHNIGLHGRRALILDNSNVLLPEWLDMVKGIVESDALCPTLSRETVQQNKSLRMIRKNLVKQCVEMFAEIAEKEKDYLQFYEVFGNCLNTGVQEDSTNRT